jgi:hypothetical protein
MVNRMPLKSIYIKTFVLMNKKKFEQCRQVETINKLYNFIIFVKRNVLFTFSELL